jgi:rod shape-determining protein MreD
MAAGNPQQIRFPAFLWALAPGASILLCIFLMLLPYGQVAGRFVTPALPLIPIYYWAVHRPELLPPLLIFALGLLQDFATAGPVGVWPVVYLVAYSVTLSQRNELEGLSMRFAWAVFGVIALIGLLAGWFAYSIYMGGFVDVLPMVLQALTTALLFPVLVWVLVFMESEIGMAMRH